MLLSVLRARREINDLSGGTTSIVDNANNKNPDTENGENATPAADFHATETGISKLNKTTYCNGTTMSFQGLVNDLSQGQMQKDVSVSFYFICLLHLCVGLLSDILWDFQKVTGNK